jgi:hypothetical protein
MSQTTLYRPVGQKEYDLIAASGFKAFPPRLQGQPIFYPVLNEEYAAFIAREWNTRDAASGFVGYVLRFKVFDAYLDRFEVRKVGSASALEYWIPAGDLDAFNAKHRRGDRSNRQVRLMYVRNGVASSPIYDLWSDATLSVRNRSDKGPLRSPATG